MSNLPPMISRSRGPASLSYFLSYYSSERIHVYTEANREREEKQSSSPAHEGFVLQRSKRARNMELVLGSPWPNLSMRTLMDIKAR